MVSVPSVPVIMMANPPGAAALPPWMLSESSAPLPSRPCNATWPGTWLAISSPVSATENPVVQVRQDGRDVGERPRHALKGCKRMASHDGQQVVAGRGFSAPGQRPGDPAAAKGIACRGHADRLDRADAAVGEQVGDEARARRVVGLQIHGVHDPGCGGGAGERAGLGQIDSERPLRVHMLARRQRGPDHRGVGRHLHARHHQVHLGMERQLLRAGEGMADAERAGGRPGAVLPGRRDGGHRELVEVSERWQVRGRGPALRAGAHDPHPYPFWHLIASSFIPLGMKLG